MNALENAIVRLLRKKPFYGHFLLNMRRADLKGSQHAAGVTIRDGVPTLSINSILFNIQPAWEQETLLEHLIKHLLHLHPLRRKGRNIHDWDVCCDLAINSTLDKLPDDALIPELFGLEAGLSAEEYYDALVHPFDTGNLDGSGYGDIQQDSHGADCQGCADVRYSSTLDDHEHWNDSDSTSLILGKEVIRTITRDSLQGSDGDMPPDVQSIVEGFLSPPEIPWRQILHQFVATAGRTGQTKTWMREHKRFGYGNPGNRKHRRLNLLVGIDVSDSTNIIKLRENFAKELLQISRGRDARITVLYANSRIQQIDVFNSSSCVEISYKGGGFTDLRPVFKFAKEMHPLPAAVIYLTDGFGQAPAVMEFPTLWVLTAEGEKPAPWGIELRLEI